MSRRRSCVWELAAGTGRLALAASALAVLAGAVGAPVHQQGAAAPPLLRDTGLYAAWDTREIDRRHLPFSPQYPLWTDGADKRRWIHLPPGTAIDASDPNAWDFPVGTKLWKEFSFDGRPIETRYMERQESGAWLYATYGWEGDGTEARLVSPRGKASAFPLGKKSYAIPGVADCKACHEGQPSAVLGFSALQLSPDRDPAAPHATETVGHRVDLDFLVARGLLKNLPAEVLATAPRVVAASPTERAALGYLHGNCGHCHNDQGPLKTLGLSLRHEVGAGAASGERALVTAVGVPVRKHAPGQTADASLRVEPGHPERSLLMQRLSSRYPALQMPPLGTVLPDDAAVSLMREWILMLKTNPQTRGEK